MVGSKLYSIDRVQIPYFNSYANFQKANGDLKLAHDDIPFFEAALAGIEKGYRHCFRKVPAEIDACRGVCETLDFLGVDVLKQKSLKETIKDLKEGQGSYDVDYKRAFYVKGNKTIARDAAFCLVYQILLGEFENEHRDSVQVFNAVNFVVSHPATFKFAARKMIRAAFEERFVASAKQIAELEKWQIRKPNEDGSEEEEDVTTEESYSDYYDEDDLDYY